MAKYYGNATKYGKVGGSVFAIRYGQTIERQYQPVVLNPQTPLQVAARAKLKLMSQLGAVLGNSIAIRRNGAQSPRNLFVKKNYPSATYANNAASVNMVDLKVTDSAVGLPQITYTRDAGALNVSLVRSDSDIDRMVYIFLIREGDNSVRIYQQVVVSKDASNPTFSHTTQVGATTALYVLGYGVRFNTTEAEIKYGELMVTAENVARVLTSSTEVMDALTVTETRGVYAATA